MHITEYEALKATVKKLFEQLTYEEQKQIIEMIEKKLIDK